MSHHPYPRLDRARHQLARDRTPAPAAIHPATLRALQSWSTSISNIQASPEYNESLRRIGQTTAEALANIRAALPLIAAAGQHTPGGAP